MTRSRIPVACALAAAAALLSGAWPRPRICWNDVAACASLRSISAAQARFQADRRIDLDRDGTGEFGYLAELAGSATLPEGDRALDEPYLSTAFRTVRPDGSISRSGYRLRVFLPGPAGKGVVEQPSARGGEAVDPALAERRWCAYAWPAEYGNTGNPTLFIDQDGIVLCADDPRYSGDRGPTGGAAYAGGGLTSITGKARAGAVAQDGNVWRPFAGH